MHTIHTILYTIDSSSKAKYDSIDGVPNKDPGKYMHVMYCKPSILCQHGYIGLPKLNAMQKQWWNAGFYLINDLGGRI